MTKILCTLGPSSLNKTTVKSLDKQGVDLFRINLSHAPLDDLEEVLLNLKTWTDVPVCLDSEGAQVRNGPMSNEQTYFNKNDLVKIHANAIVGEAAGLSSPFPFSHVA